MCKITEWWVIKAALQGRSPNATILASGFFFFLDNFRGAYVYSSITLPGKYLTHIPKHISLLSNHPYFKSPMPIVLDFSNVANKIKPIDLVMLHVKTD